MSTIIIGHIIDETDTFIKYICNNQRDVSLVYVFIPLTFIVQTSICGAQMVLE